MASIIDDALRMWRARADELDRQIKPLSVERDELRAAIAKLEAILASGPGARASHRVASVAHVAAVNGRRAPRGENRRRILAAIAHQPKTASEIARETNITVGTVATTLTKMVKDGSATKASRGYKAAR